MKYKILFAASWRSTLNISKDEIILVPSNDSWNNFGHRNKFLLWRSGERQAISILLSFIEKKDSPESNFLNPDSIVKKKFEKNDANSLPASDFPDFFTMLYDMDDYRKIISKEGVTNGNEILKSINDLVFTQAKNSNAHWYKNAIESEAFTLSFMRSSHTIFAFYNASSILSGVEHEDLSAAETQLSISFQLPAFNTKHKFEFNFKFSGIIRKQIAVIIGKNGVGKSRTLHQLVNFAIDGDKSFQGKNGRLPRLSKIVAISTPGETHSTFPPETDNSRIRYERLLSEHARQTESSGRRLPEILIQLAMVQSNQIGENSRWDLFEELVSGFADISQLVIGNSNGSIDDFVELQSLVRGGEQKMLEAMGRMDKNGLLLKRVHDLGVFPMSSGQVSFVRLAAQLSHTVENGTLILIDEPETHLHPNLITDFVGMLNKILELTGSIAIVATHSAYLVREVPRSQVHVIQEDDGDIEVVSPRLKTFGADVGAISEFVFGDGIVNRLVIEVEQRLKRSPELRNVWQEKLKTELSPEAIMYLAEALEDADSDSDEENI